MSKTSKKFGVLAISNGQCPKF